MSQDSVYQQYRLCVMTLVETTQEAQGARLLIKSLRLFGGPLRHAPVWMFFQPELPIGDLLDIFADVEGIQFIPLNLDRAAPGSNYPFGSKVHACAQAEASAGASFRTLVWFNPGCLIVNPPSLFNLAPSFDAAFRPVHHQNIGSPAHNPPDDYWQAVYHSVGLDEAPFTVESFADLQTLRPYFNTHCFSIHPALGLFSAWQQCFRVLVDDVAFQSGPCRGPLQRIFLHQAVLSALVAKRLFPQRIRLLPPGYSYPLHMHPQISPNRRPFRLNDLVCPVYEGAFEYPVTLNGLQADEPLDSWLLEFGN
jgi:hypothetical protein